MSKLWSIVPTGKTLDKAFMKALKSLGLSVRLPTAWITGQCRYLRPSSNGGPSGSSNSKRASGLGLQNFEVEET